MPGANQASSKPEMDSKISYPYWPLEPSEIQLDSVVNRKRQVARAGTDWGIKWQDSGSDLWVGDQISG